MLPFFLLTALVGLGLSMDISTGDEDDDRDSDPIDMDRLERTTDFADVIGSNANNLLNGDASDNTINFLGQGRAEGVPEVSARGAGTWLAGA